MDDEGAADLNRIDQLSVPVQAELEEVGQDEIWKGVAVALELLRVLDVDEVLFGGILGLD